MPVGEATYDSIELERVTDLRRTSQTNGTGIPMKHHALADQFQEYFNVVPVMHDSLQDSLMIRIFRLRYEVYCREFGFEREEDCPGGVEQNYYDHRAFHAAVIHRSSHRLAGCVRLICPNQDQADPGSVLPLEQFCGDSLDHAELYPQAFPSSQICEVSRLAVRSDFRRRPGEKDNPAGISKDFDAGKGDEARTYPLISVALFLAAVALSGLSGRPRMFAMMEPRLRRLLIHSGLHFTQVGRVLEYHGMRAAFYMHHLTAMEHMKPGLRALYGVIQQQLRSSGVHEDTLTRELGVREGRASGNPPPEGQEHTLPDATTTWP